MMLESYLKESIKILLNPDSVILQRIDKVVKCVIMTTSDRQTYGKTSYEKETTLR